jgi:DNA sulfur modification protein DndD
MIKKLILEKFGRFSKHTVFDFASATLFFGNNESGKTTLFDAIFNAVSTLKGNSEYGKILASRYGNNRVATLECEGERISIAEKDFINLFAIRSGKISLEVNKNSEMMNHVKDSLFSGGIDPKAVAAELEKDIKGRGKNTLAREKEELTKELAELETNKKNAENIRNKCLAEEKRVADIKENMAQAKEKSSQLEKKREELERTLEQQNLLRQEKGLRINIENIAKMKRIIDELEKKYNILNPETLNNLQMRAQEIQHLKAKLNADIALEAETLNKLNNCINEKSKCETEKAGAESKEKLASFLKDTLVPREKLVCLETRRVWKKPMLIAAGAFFLAGILLLACFLTAFFAIHWAIFAAVLAAAGACVATASVRQTKENNSLLHKTVQDAREKWKKETGEDAGEHYEDILAVFSRVAEKLKTATENFNREAKRANEFEQEKIERAKEKKQTEDAESTAQRQLRNLLDNAGVNAITDYAALLEKKKNLIVQRTELEEKLKKDIEYNKVSSIEELENILSRKLAEISVKITETELPESESRIKENLLKQTKEHIETLRLKEIENTGSLNLDLGTIRGQFQGIPEKIAACEKDMQKKKMRIAEINKELQAKGIAQKLFDYIAEDSSLMLETLSKEISQEFSKFTGAGRAVSMVDFSTDNTCVIDAQNFNRENKHLSAGTLDAFYLAARLVLAKKSQDANKQGIIVLDEPFLALDRPRTNCALAVLGEFRKNTGWQIILFTKDEELANEAHLVFGSELCVHNLNKL